jgi:YHS domain-containing protein
MRALFVAVLFLLCIVACSEKNAPENQQPSMQSAAQTEVDSLAENIVIDPVCGMELDKTKVTLTSVYNGTTYYFCNESEIAVFEKDPQRFLSAE